MTPGETIERLMAAFEALDFESLYDLVHEDVVYQNMPQNPIFGKAGLRALFGSFGDVSRIRFELLNIAVNGNVVLTEHRDHLVINGRPCLMPMMTSFTLKDGLVAEWREYYDMPTFERQLGHRHPGARS